MLTFPGILADMLPEEANVDPAFWGYFVGGHLVAIDIAEDFARRHSIDVLYLIERFRASKREGLDMDKWHKVLESVMNTQTRINNWLLDRHLDDFASLPFPGVQTVVLYWDQAERERWHAKQPGIGKPPKLPNGWYLLFKCRQVYTEGELVRVNSIESHEEIEARQFKNFLLNELKAIGSDAESRENALRWVSLFDYSGAGFVWFKAGGRRGREVVHHVGKEGVQAFFNLLRAGRERVEAV